MRSWTQSPLPLALLASLSACSYTQLQVDGPQEMTLLGVCREGKPFAFTTLASGDSLSLGLPDGFTGPLFVQARKGPGACDVLGTATIMVTPTSGAALSVTIPKSPTDLCQVDLTPDPQGKGLGRVRLDGDFFTASCKAPAAFLPKGTASVARAEDGPSSHFGAWSGALCGGSGRRCEFTASALLESSAQFRSIPMVARFDPGLCLSDSLCWENPLPQGQTLRSVLLGEGGGAWAVGAGGTALRYDPGEGPGWRTVPGADPKRTLYAVAGDSAAPWVSGEGGQLLAYTANGRLETPNGAAVTSETLYGLAARGQQVVAVGGNGTVIANDLVNGFTLRQVAAPRPALLQVALLTEGSFLAIADSGQLLRGQGGALSLLPCAGPGDLLGMALRDDQFLLVGPSGRAFQGRLSMPGTCTPLSVPDSLGALRAVAFAGPAGTTGAWAGGDGGELRRRTDDGGALVTVTPRPPAAQTLYSVAMDPSGLKGLLGGAGGLLWRYDVPPGGGAPAWREERTLGLPRSERGPIRAVTGVGRDSLLAVGDKGLVLAFTDGAWRTEDLDDNQGEDLRAVASDGTESYAVGERGAIFHRQGGKWRREPSATRADLYAVAMGRTHVFAVGAWDESVAPATAAVRLDRQGGAFERVALSYSRDPRYAVLILDPEVCMAGAAKFQQNLGTTNVACSSGPDGPFIGEDSGTTATLYSLFRNGDDVYAAGDQVLLRRTRGDRRWTLVGRPPETLYAGVTTGAAVSLAVGQSGTLWRRDPGSTSFSPVLSVTGNPLYGITALSSQDVVIVGDGGTILRYFP